MRLIAQGRTTGLKNAGLCIPTYVLGIRQKKMSQSGVPIDILCEILHQVHNLCRVISRSHKIHFGASSKSLSQLSQPQLFSSEISMLLLLLYCISTRLGKGLCSEYNYPFHTGLVQPPSTLVIKAFKAKMHDEYNA
jgi:hypothetical protein